MTSDCTNTTESECVVFISHLLLFSPSPEDVSELLSERGLVTESVLGIFISLVCILVILVVVLSIKLKRQGSAGNKKQAKSLWQEFNPLNPCPED